jgi:hypothetical protein
MTMMKHLFKIMAITSLFSLTGWVGYGFSVWGEPLDPLMVPQSKQAAAPVSVFLPTSAKVMLLKDRRSMSGRLMSFDARAKTITIKSSGTLQTIPMKEIQGLTFEGEVVLRNGTAIVIRGDSSQKSPNQNGKVFQEPLGNFQLVDGKKGEARVMITNPLDRKGMQAVAKDSSYVVEEIRFEPSDRIQVRVTPR